ncbi:MAG: SoxR reducing system RseC family protein [Pseudomonadota bacterium]
MSREQAFVHKTKEDVAIVYVKRSTACEHCNSKSVCQTIDSGMNEIKVKNSISAKEGDTVIIELGSTKVVKASLLVYGLPIFSFLIGAIFGFSFSNILSISKDSAALIFGFSAVCISIVIIKLVSNKLEKSGTFTPDIIKILKQ